MNTIENLSNKINELAQVYSNVYNSKNTFIVETIIGELIEQIDNRIEEIRNEADK